MTKKTREERAKRIDELCAINGPLTVEEAQELRRLSAEERFERNWGDEEG